MITEWPFLEALLWRPIYTNWLFRYTGRNFSRPIDHLTTFLPLPFKPFGPGYLTISTALELPILEVQVHSWRPSPCSLHTGADLEFHFSQAWRTHSFSFTHTFTSGHDWPLTPPALTRQHIIRYSLPFDSANTFGIKPFRLLILPIWRPLILESIWYGKKWNHFRSTHCISPVGEIHLIPFISHICIPHSRSEIYLDPGRP